MIGGSPSQWAPRALLCSGGTAAALIAVELLARLVLPPHEGMRARPGPAPAARTEARLSAHPEQGFVYVTTPTGRRLRQNAHVVIERHALSGRKIAIDTNALGFRNREIGPKTGTRILFLGDSVTFGDYLPEEETFVRQVESQARREGRDWETINAGVGGIGLKNEVAILIESGLALLPDVVVVNYYLNDFEPSPGVFVPAPPAFLRFSRLAWHLWQHWGRRRAGDPSGEGVDTTRWLADFRRPVRPEGDYRVDPAAFNARVTEAFPDWGGAWSPEAWRLMQPHFDLLAALSRRYSFQLLIVGHPVAYQVDSLVADTYPQDRLREVAAGLGAPVLDLLPLLRSLNAAAPGDLFYDQCHHTPRASAAVARAITGFLRENIE